MHCSCATNRNRSLHTYLLAAAAHSPPSLARACSLSLSLSLYYTNHAQLRPKGYFKLIAQNPNKSSKQGLRAREEGVHITLILPIDAAGKDGHHKSWGIIANGIVEKAPSMGFREEAEEEEEEE